MAIGFVSEVICDDPKIIEHRTYEIVFNANRYRWDCGNRTCTDIFYIKSGSNEPDWLRNKRAFVKNLFAKEQNNG